MIKCDNDNCTIEWFHYDCMRLKSKPKGKWFCPNCRGDKPSVMKPRSKESTRTRNVKKHKRFSFDIFTSQQSREAKDAAKKAKEAAKSAKKAKAEKVKKKSKKGSTTDKLADFLSKNDPVLKRHLSGSGSDSDSDGYR